MYRVLFGAGPLNAEDPATLLDLMETRLYVGNLSDDASVEELRKRFDQCGAVADVQLATDRSSGRMRGYAFVTMKTPADARSAITQLNGAMFDDRPLRVSEAGEQREGARSKVEGPKVKITSQFRERLNMTYELDIAGTLIAIRMFPTPDESGKESWRLEALAKEKPDEVVSASAPRRADALSEIARTWEERIDSGLPPLDWKAVADALETVRAI